MKIKDFNDKAKSGTKIVYAGRVYTIQDINRTTHEAQFAGGSRLIRCSEFELCQGGEIPPYVEDKEPAAKMGRPPKPVIAIFKSGRTSVFDSIDKASEVLNISIHMINRVLYGKAKYAKGIRFQR